MDVLSLVCVALVTFCVTVVGIAIYLTVIEHWKRQEQRQEINQRLAEQVQRKYVPCLKCVPEGRLCAFHTAELIEQLKAKVA